MHYLLVDLPTNEDDGGDALPSHETSPEPRVEKIDENIQFMATSDERRE